MWDYVPDQKQTISKFLDQPKFYNNFSFSFDPNELGKYPNNLWLYAYHMGWPSVFGWVLCCSYYAQNRHFRAAIIRVFRPKIQPVTADDDCTA